MTSVTAAPPAAAPPPAAPPAAPPLEAQAPGARGLELRVSVPRPAQDARRILSEAEVFVKYGLLERAADHLRRLVELQPDHPQARRQLGSVLRQLGRAPLAARPVR